MRLLADQSLVVSVRHRGAIPQRIHKSVPISPGITAPPRPPSHRALHTRPTHHGEAGPSWDRNSPHGTPSGPCNESPHGFDAIHHLQHGARPSGPAPGRRLEGNWNPVTDSLPAAGARAPNMVGQCNGGRDLLADWAAGKATVHEEAREKRQESTGPRRTAHRGRSGRRPQAFTGSGGLPTPLRLRGRSQVRGLRAGEQNTQKTEGADKHFNAHRRMRQLTRAKYSPKSAVASAGTRSSPPSPHAGENATRPRSAGKPISTARLVCLCQTAAGCGSTFSATALGASRRNTSFR